MIYIYIYMYIYILVVSRRYPSTMSFCCSGAWLPLQEFWTCFVDPSVCRILAACNICRSFGLSLLPPCCGGKSQSSWPWNGGFGDSWASIWLWYGGFKGPWPSRWQWNGGFKGSWPSSWPWNAGFGNAWAPGKTPRAPRGTEKNAQ